MHPTPYRKAPSGRFLSSVSKVRSLEGTEYLDAPHPTPQGSMREIPIISAQDPESSTHRGHMHATADHKAPSGRSLSSVPKVRKLESKAPSGRSLSSVLNIWNLQIKEDTDAAYPSHQAYMQKITVISQQSTDTRRNIGHRCTIPQTTKVHPGDPCQQSPKSGH